MPSPLIQFITPLASAGTAASSAYQMTRASSVTGTAIADVAGTLYVDQGGDGVNWDSTTSFAIAPNTGISFNVPLITQYFRVRYTNGGTPQTIFRVFADPRDPYGTFLAAAQAASPGGAYGVLLFNTGSNSYQYIGRYDGADAFNAISNAAVVANQSGKYAAFAVASASVSDETLQKTTTHSADSF